MNKPTKTHTVEEAKLKLMRYCTYRERCHKEVQEKLRQLNMIPEARDVIIHKLITHNFLNEERFVNAFVHDKFHLKKWGRYRIKRELKFREISDYLIQKGLQQINENEYQETFNQLTKKRLKQIPETHPLKIKKKLADYLLRKGYESHLVYESLQKLNL